MTIFSVEREMDEIRRDTEARIDAERRDMDVREKQLLSDLEAVRDELVHMRNRDSELESEIQREKWRTEQKCF